MCHSLIKPDKMTDILMRQNGIVPLCMLCMLSLKNIKNAIMGHDT